MKYQLAARRIPPKFTEAQKSKTPTNTREDKYKKSIGIKLIRTSNLLLRTLVCMPNQLSGQSSSATRLREALPSRHSVSSIKLSRFVQSVLHCATFSISCIDARTQNKIQTTQIGHVLMKMWIHCGLSTVEMVSESLKSRSWRSKERSGNAVLAVQKR